jgi:hypothetical protein
MKPRPREHLCRLLAEDLRKVNGGAEPTIPTTLPDLPRTGNNYPPKPPPLPTGGG